MKKEEPRRAEPRIDGEDPALSRFSTGGAKPNCEKLLKNSDEPGCRKSRIDKTNPSRAELHDTREKLRCTKSTKDEQDPRCAKFREDDKTPKHKKSTVDKENKNPNLATPKVETDTPTRAGLHGDGTEPTCR